MEAESARLMLPVLTMTCASIPSDLFGEPENSDGEMNRVNERNERDNYQGSVNRWATVGISDFDAARKRLGL